ncbi:MAG: hypothetical protein ACXWQO_19745, partial [Bdellovibrionota bacterium]
LKINDSPDTFPETTATDLLMILDKTQIMVVDEELTAIKGKIKQKSAAVNFVSPNRILINRKAWNAINDAKVRQSLALHEVLSLAGIEETGVYNVVSRLESIEGRPVHFDKFGQIWKFREIEDEEQIQLNAIMPIIPGYEKPSQINSVSQRIRFAAKVNTETKELIVQVLRYDLDNIETNISHDFYQILVTDDRDQKILKTIVMEDMNFRLVTGDRQELQVYHLATDNKGQAGYQIISLNGDSPYFYGFWGIQRSDLADVVSLDNHLETLVLGKIKNGPFGLYLSHMPELPVLIKAFKSVVPGYEDSYQAKIPGTAPMPFVSSILGVYKNERGTYAMVNDIDGIVVVNIETGESKAIYEVPEEGRFASVIHSKAPNTGGTCTEIFLGIYNISQGKMFYSDDIRGSDIYFPPSGNDYAPVYTLHLGVSATQKFFTVSPDGCR